MKTFIVLLICIMLLPITIAADIDINIPNNAYSPGETAWMQISSNVNLSKDLTSDMINLARGGGSITTTKAILKVSKNVYFYYFIVPKLDNGNYKIVIKNVNYVKSNIINKADFESNFTIVNKNDTLQLWPGVLFSEFQEVEDPKLQAEVRNSGWDKTRIIVTSENASLVTSVAPFDFNLIGQSMSWIHLSTNITDYSKGFYSTFIDINSDKGGSYKFPFILKKKWYAGEFEWTKKEENTNETNTTSTPIENITLNKSASNQTANETYVYPADSLKFIDPLYKEVNQTVKVNSPKIGTDWSVKNFAERNLTNINYSLTDSLGDIISINIANNSGSLQPGEELKINVAVYPNQSKKGSYEGKLIVFSAEGVNDSVSFNIKFSNETSEIKNKAEGTTFKVINNTNGTVLTYGESENTGSTNTAWIVILIIIAVIGIIALVFYKKSRPKKERFDEYLKALGK